MIKDNLIKVHDRIKPYIHNTPVLNSRLINEIAGSRLFFKCENFQKMGAFKMRGATNAILQLTDAQKSKVVVTHSSGNFAQALSLAAVLKEQETYKNKKIGVIISGGNVDLNRLPFIQR